jgi:ABC-type amino acid transport substrate-binding protein
MLKSWLTTVWFSLTIPFASADEFQPLRWGYVEFPPYHYSENGKVVGAIAEKVDYIFKQTKIEYSAFVFPNKRVKLYIEKGEIDFTVVIDSFISDPSLFLKTEQPVYKIKLGAICLKNTHQINKLDDLKSLKLILMSGYTYGQDRVFDAKNGFNIAISASNHESAIKALAYKRADCVLGYQSPFLVEELKYPETHFYFYLINELPAYLYLFKNTPNAISIMKEINQYNQ